MHDDNKSVGRIQGTRFTREYNIMAYLKDGPRWSRGTGPGRAPTGLRAILGSISAAQWKASRGAGVSVTE